MIWFLAGLALGVLATYVVARRPAGPDHVAIVSSTPEPATEEAADTGPQRPAVDAEAQRLAAVVRVLPIGVVIVNRDGAVTYRNDLAAGFASGRHGDAIVDGRVRALAAVALRGRAGEDAVDLYGPPRQALELRASPIVEPGDDRPTSAVVLIVDRTEEHRTEVVRRDFVANVSHELRTPVGAIGVLAETLVSSDDPEVVDRLAGRLHREALRLGSTIEDLLTLSSIEGGEGVATAPVPVATLIEAALDRVQPAAEARGVSIETSSADRLAILGDHRQLVSALANLVENAIKYSEPDASVQIVAERVDTLVEVRVIDTGRGIPERDLERIFERFYRVDAARSRETGGTGLGLSIVRNIVHGHGGEVDVTSIEGEGSQFTMRLPSVAPSASGDDASPAETITVGGETA